MFRIISLAVFSLLIALGQTVYAQDQNYNYSRSYQAVGDDIEEDYNFENNSYYVSDEQMQPTEDINQIEDESETSLLKRIINSSHFSSGTATRTYIPLLKNK